MTRPDDEDRMYETNRELGRAEQREIDRRVRWGMEQRAAEFERMRAAVQDPDYVARLAADMKAQGLVEVDNPMRREVRPRRGTEEGR